MLIQILEAFGLNGRDSQIEDFGSGLINHTWKVSVGANQYILQCINKNVFKNPQHIADNLAILKKYLKANAPENYIFAAPLPAKNGRYTLKIEGEYYRLSPFIENSHTVDFISNGGQAYEAAKQFGRFTKLLNGFDPQQLQYTLPDFHNLNLRVDQFRSALLQCDAERLKLAEVEISEIEANLDIAVAYQQLTANKQIPLRVIHHDAKINNVLFDDQDKGLCVIDLDTIMPGYYISDVGDMMRTYLSEANEEEQVLSKIQIKEDYFAAVYLGYTEEMGKVLTPAEKDLFIYAGKFMIYMQAVRFLTDFLNGDIYYTTKYPGHNLNRAKNQLTLLQQYMQAEKKFHRIISQLEQNIAQLH